MENSLNATRDVTQIEAEDGKNGEKWKSFRIIRKKKYEKSFASRLFALRNGFLDFPTSLEKKNENSLGQRWGIKGIK